MIFHYGNTLTRWNLKEGTYVPDEDPNVFGQIYQVEGPSILNYNSENNEFKFSWKNTALSPLRLAVHQEFVQSLYYKLSFIEDNFFRVSFDGKNFQNGSTVNLFLKLCLDNNFSYSKKQKFSYPVKICTIKDPEGIVIYNKDNEEFVVELNSENEFVNTYFSSELHVATKYIFQERNNVLYEKLTSEVDELYNLSVLKSEFSNLDKMLTDFVDIYVFYISDSGQWSKKIKINTIDIG